MTLNEFNKVAVFLETFYEIDIGKFDICNFSIHENAFNYYVNILGKISISKLDDRPFIEIVISKEELMAFFEDGR